MSLEGQWVEVFSVPRGGNTGGWTEADAERLVALYNPAIYEAPVVIGHPESDAPAYGWVEQLRVEKNGKTSIWAKLHQVDPQFAEMVQQGRFKQRSVGLYPHLEAAGGGPYLRHLGFLGAAAPLVKGLKPIQFGDAEHIEFAVTQENPMDEKKEKEPGVAERFFDHVRQFFGAEKAAPVATFTEAQLNQRLTEQSEKLSQEFTEQLSTLRKELSDAQQASEKKVAQLADQQREASIDAYWDAGVKKGNLLPAFEQAYGLKSLLKQLAGSSVVLTFTEKKDGKEVEIKRGGAEVLERFLDDLPKLVRYENLTARARTAAARGGKVLHMVESGTREIAGVEKDARIRALIADSKTKNPDRPLTYAEALQIVTEQEAAEGAGQEA